MTLNGANWFEDIQIEDCINKLKTQSEMAAIERGIAIELM
jgi:hypothetical protein